MEHDFLELDEFIAEAVKAPEKNVPTLLPFQEEGLQMGCWGLSLEGLREGKNPLGWKVAVFYIYAKQDYIALSAMQGGDTNEMIAEAEEAFANGVLKGRLYSPENMTGELAEIPAVNLIPISEDQAQEVQFYEYKLPIIFGMCDWFEPLIDKLATGFVEHGVDGLEVIICPKCGDERSVFAVATFTAQGGFSVLKGEGNYKLVSSEGFKVNQVSHCHLVCANESCDYNECVDLNEFEINTDTV